MYLHTKDGFFEIDRFQGGKIPGPYPQPPQHGIIIRTRRIEYLQSMLKTCGKSWEKHFGLKILHTPEWDYPYRLYMTEVEFAEVMAKIVISLDYQNFKKWCWKNKAKHEDLAHKIWGDGFEDGQDKS